MRSHSPSPALVFALIFVAIFLLHLPLLRLPYFWDEAGYYIPAARDLLLTGTLIPHSTPSNAHPPLVMAYLAACWKIFGFSQLVTRTAMLAVAAFSLLGVYRLGRRVANLQIALAATACTALYPVFFAQSTMAHVDLAAAGLTLWAFEAYLGQRWRAAAVWFSLAVLAKETAVLAPPALLAWEVVSLLPQLGRWNEFVEPATAASLKPAAATNDGRHKDEPAGPTRRLTERTAWLARAASLLTPVLVLSLWYAYHYARTGYVFGNPEFFRYNVQATMSGVRILLALGMRIWQSFGYMHLWVLMLLVMWAMTRPPLRDGSTERRRIDIPVQLTFAVLILAFITAMAVVGGAVLARYMLTVIPLVILIAVSTLWRRVRGWLWLVGLTCLAFVLALFFNPPYGFSPEDNLAYRDYILMHQDAESFVDQRYPQARVLTAWPASDEITQPYLGYVKRPFRVVRIEDFSLDEVAGAAEQRSRFDVALVFSTKYEPAHPLLERWRAWDKMKMRFFGFHRDVPPAVAAQLLGGRVVFTEKMAAQWVAVIEVERVLDAGLR
ncbi:MAG TPA: glycosyltransferase family 39 protein [Terriglobales bacterium]|nr:glycosyltransferase family 39 protein [Terriglobales bacterium]